MQGIYACLNRKFTPTLRWWYWVTLVLAIGAGWIWGAAPPFLAAAPAPESYGPQTVHDAKLTAPDHAFLDYFGEAVALQLNSQANPAIYELAVGAPQDDDGGEYAGAVYLYHSDLSRATLVRKIHAPDATADLRFGQSVILAGDLLVVGAPYADTGGQNSGAVYLFARNQGGLDNWGQIKKLIASDADAYDYFGSALAASVDWIAIGAPEDEERGFGSGSVYLYARNQGGANNWGQVKKLTAADGLDSDNFGNALTMSSDFLAVGAPRDDDLGVNAGVVYLFGRNLGGANNWGQSKKLYGSTTVAGDYFGSALDLDGDTLVSGAAEHDSAGEAAGAVYFFGQNQGGANNWGQLTTRTAADGAAYDRFGQAVAINGDLAVVTASEDDPTGSAYLLGRNTGGPNNWGEVKKLLPGEVVTGNAFGRAVALANEHLVIGASSDNEAGASAGAAYLFASGAGGANNWGQTTKLLPADNAVGDRLGTSLAVSGNFLLTGAPYDNNAQDEAGAAYLFARSQSGANQWNFVKKFVDPTTRILYQDLGRDVALSGDRAVVAAEPLEQTGAAYIYDRNQGGVDQWGLVKKVTFPDGPGWDSMGTGVALESETLAFVTVVVDFDGNYWAGAGIFERNQGGPDNWGQVVDLTIADGEPKHRFGRSLALNNDTLIVGAPHNRDGQNASGAAYIYYRNQGGANRWGQVQKVKPFLITDSRFGTAVAISGDIAVVGAPSDNERAANAGAVYLFARNQGGANQWGEIKKLTANDAAAGDFFGGAVRINGDVLVVGAAGDDYTNGLDAGAVYIFVRNQGGVNNWGQAAKLTASDQAVDDVFGQALAIGDNVIAVGAPGNDGKGSNAGAAYLYASNPAFSCFRLTLTQAGDGNPLVATPSHSLTCAENHYIPGEVITLHAAPSAGWQIVGWQGTDNNSSKTTSNSVTMPITNHSVNVTYGRTCFALTTTHSGTGSDPSASPSNSSICTVGQYTPGTVITLNASPASGWQVQRWLGTSNDGSTAPNNTLTMPANDHTVQVVYTPRCFPLTLTHTGSGNDPAATPPHAAACAPGNYHVGDSINLTANPATGWQVSGWSGVSDNGLTTNNNSLVMPAANHTATVHYGEIPTSAPGDLYELDNSCTRSRVIATDGSEVQNHSFHAGGDVDWVRFDTTANTRYRLDVTVPTTSTADVVMEVYGDCASTPLDQWTGGFSPGARLEISRPVSGPLYIRLSNVEPATAGAGVRYDLTVRKLDEAPLNRALIIVAGRLKLSDAVQPNIDKVASNVYKLFQRNGYNDDNIQLLASNANLPGYDGAASKASVQAAIQQAANRVANGVLTLYLIDHGTPELFYIDGVNGQTVTPTELNEWLTQLEGAAPGVKINVIIEACESGSFIDKPGTISKPGRVVLTSSNADNDAKASKEGAYFSDHLLTWLQQGFNLSASFLEARNAARNAYSLQEAWLDSNGNGLANEFDDSALAAQRAFAYAGTLADNEWPPHIFQASIVGAVREQKVRLRVDVRDNSGVRQVWVVVYEPGYTPPAPTQVLQPEVLPTFLFTRVDNDNHWEAEITGLTQTGVYRLVIQADDEQGLVARPISLEVTTSPGGQRESVYLPLVRK